LFAFVLEIIFGRWWLSLGGHFDRAVGLSRIWGALHTKLFANLVNILVIYLGRTSLFIFVYLVGLGHIEKFNFK